MLAYSPCVFLLLDGEIQPIMLIPYLRVVLQQAQYQVSPEDERIHGEIPGFEGVCASGDTLEECRHQLAEVLEDWIEVRVSRRLPLPRVEGVQLPHPQD